MCKLRYRNGAPRRPPRILIVGPPGSGKTEQAKKVADTFGLVNISMKELLKNEMHVNPDMADTISGYIEKGEPVPDNIVNSCLENRLKQPDCRVNGWVIEGFPENENQMNLLKAMRIKPMLCFILEQHQEECIRRLSYRRIDPQTGILYNCETEPSRDEAVNARLICLKED